MAEQIIEPRFPFQGVVRRVGNWGDMAMSEKPFTPWAVNVFPEGPYYSRLRGGSRPGLTETTDDRTVRAALLVNEDGDYIVTETGDFISVASFSGGEAGLGLESGSGTLLTEGGGDLQVAVEGAIPTSDGRTWVDIGEDAPADLSPTCLYRDRVCMSSTDTMSVYFSRLGKYHDWNIYADVEDETRAALLQLVEAGEWYSNEEGVSCLVPYKDRALLAATPNTLWVLMGDPIGGQFRCVSRDVGIVNQKAWCLAEDAIYFLSARGLYVIGGNGEGMKPLSEESIPEQLAGVGSAILGYRAEDQSIYIFTDGTYNWIYHIPTGGFWAFTLSSTHAPEEVYKDGRDLVLIDSSSTARSIGGDDDDGTDIESHLLLGPFRSSSGDMTGIVTTIEGALGEDSGDVEWHIVSADSAEKAAEDAKTAVGLYIAGNLAGAQEYQKASGVYSSGRSLRSHPRVRGQWFVVWLQSSNKWSFEWLALRVSERGRYR